MTPGFLRRTVVALREGRRDATLRWGRGATIAAALVVLAALVPAIAPSGVRIEGLAGTLYLALAAAVGLAFCVGLGGMPSLAQGAFVTRGRREPRSRARTGSPAARGGAARGRGRRGDRARDRHCARPAPPGLRRGRDLDRGLDRRARARRVSRARRRRAGARRARGRHRRPAAHGHASLRARARAPRPRGARLHRLRARPRRQRAERPPAAPGRRAGARRAGGAPARDRLRGIGRDRRPRGGAERPARRDLGPGRVHPVPLVHAVRRRPRRRCADHDGVSPAPSSSS